MTTQDLVIQSNGLLAQSRQLIVVDQESLEFVSRFLGHIRAWREQIAAECDPTIAATHLAHKEAVALKRRAEEPLIEAEQNAKRVVADYLEGERKLREEAERKTREAEEAAKKVAQQLETAALLEQVGATEKAGEILAQAEATEAAAPLPEVIPEKPVAPGLTTREVWKFEIINELDLPRAYLIPDESRIRAEVQKRKAGCSIPGVKVWMERVSVFTARRD